MARFVDRDLQALPPDPWPIPRGPRGAKRILKTTTGTADPTELRRRWPTVLQRHAALEAEWVRKLTYQVLTKIDVDGMAAN